MHLKKIHLCIVPHSVSHNYILLIIYCKGVTFFERNTQIIVPCIAFVKDQYNYCLYEILPSICMLLHQQMALYRYHCFLCLHCLSSQLDVQFLTKNKVIHSMPLHLDITTVVKDDNQYHILHLCLIITYLLPTNLPIKSPK